MKLLQLLIGLMTGLCCSVLAHSDLEQASSSCFYSVWFWIQIVFAVVYVGLGVLLYRDRGFSRVFILYIGLGALFALIAILTSIDWFPKKTDVSLNPSLQTYQQFAGAMLIGQSVYLNGLVGEYAKYNEASGYVKSYDAKTDTYSATVNGGIMSFFATHEITGLKRLNLGVYALLVTRVKRAQNAVDARMREIDDATRTIALKEAQVEDRRRDMDTFQLMFERKEYTVGTRVTYAGKRGKIASVKETPQGKRYTVTLTNWYGGSIGEVADVEISKLPLVDGVAAASNFKESKRRYDAARASLDGAKSTKSRLEESLRDLEVQLSQEEHLQKLEIAQQAKARALAHSQNVVKKADH